jgi:hypothetical protein
MKSAGYDIPQNIPLSVTKSVILKVDRVARAKNVGTTCFSPSVFNTFEMARIEMSHPSPDDLQALDTLDPAEYAAKEKRLVRKIDARLMPCLILMIVMNYLDRNALANARVQGIEKTLGLHGDQFNTAISVLFAGYIALQVPSNAILTRTRPSVYLVCHCQ